MLYGFKAEVPDEEFLIPIGKANTLRNGNDITLVSFGKPVHLLLQAADELARDNIERDTTQGFDFHLTGVVNLANILDLDDCCHAGVCLIPG